MILLIDNYDSFSYNLYQLVASSGREVKVVRNDEMSVGEIAALRPESIILSPGPGRPENAGVCVEVVRRLGADIPILGVCLGHQAICVAYGGKVGYAKKLMHGKQSHIRVLGGRLFKGLESGFTAARYHSLAATELPEELIATAVSDDGEIMAVEHCDHPVYGVQFHPESVLTPCGAKIIENFFKGGRQ